MRPPVSVWQGCSDYWQPAFIRENLLPLGHAAWQGYLNHGRGLVACQVEEVEVTTFDWSGDEVQYDARYIPAAAVPNYLKAQCLKADFIDRLMAAVQTYCPEGEMLMAIAEGGFVEINWLRNLAISPPDCYQQVCNRWDEFALESNSGRRCGDDG